jgi:hypothetical protein
MVPKNEMQLQNERLVRFLFDKVYSVEPTLEQLIKDDVISGTRLSELAISKATGIEFDPIGIGRDLIDGSDIKTGKVSVFASSRGVRHACSVRRVNTKLGMLRIIVHNSFFGFWHFFKIPSDAYNNNVWIPYSMTNGYPEGKYAEYRIETWENFCK